MRQPRLPFRPVWLLLAALLTGPSGGGAGQDPPRFKDRVEVARILLDVRAIDLRGHPLLGLEPSHFEVKIDGRVARVESVQHVTGERLVAAATTPTSTVPTGPGQSATPGRVVVFLFQKSMEGSRIPGLIKMLRELKRATRTFSPNDQVAVLRFDSRLHLLLDFTQDVDRVSRAFEHSVLFGEAARGVEPQVPSLRPALDLERDKPSYSMESALLRLAEALAPLPGAKSVIVVGHGFGRLTSMGVRLEDVYDDAREALKRARATVFCLDVTNADYHSLEAGLQTVAEDTGGLYQRTHEFSRAALDRVVAALEGQYVLFVEAPTLAAGTHRLDVRLKGRDGVVLAASTYER